MQSTGTVRLIVCVHGTRLITRTFYVPHVHVHQVYVCKQVVYVYSTYMSCVCTHTCGTCVHPGNTLHYSRLQNVDFKFIKNI